MGRRDCGGRIKLCLDKSWAQSYVKNRTSLGHAERTIVLMPALYARLLFLLLRPDLSESIFAQRTFEHSGRAGGRQKKPKGGNEKLPIAALCF